MGELRSASEKYFLKEVLLNTSASDLKMKFDFRLSSYKCLYWKTFFCPVQVIVSYRVKDVGYNYHSKFEIRLSPRVQF